MLHGAILGIKVKLDKDEAGLSWSELLLLCSGLLLCRRFLNNLLR